MFSSPQTLPLVALLVALAAPGLGWRPARERGDPTIDRLLARMNERLALMPDVARWKRQAKRPVTDPAREAALLAEVADRGAARGFDPAFVRRFFAAQIDAAKEVQQAALDRWKTDGGGPVGPVRDLAALRVRIDRLNAALIDALVAADAALADVSVRRALPARARRLLTAAGVTDRVRAIAVAPLVEGR